MRWRSGGEGGGGGHAGTVWTVWSRYQIIARPSGTQIGEQNCQIRKHVVMQQWNEIDRRQETERGEEADAAGLTVTCQTAQQSLTGRERGASIENSKRAPNFDATQQDHPSKYPVDAPCFV